MRLILLRLEGPLQSWGEHSKWDDRDTARFPTKSGIIGLIACCAGYPRGDERIDELHRSLHISVRGDNMGKLDVDFHTVKSDRMMKADGTVKNHTIISHRQYLENASFLAAISSDNNKLLDRIAEVLQNPVWTPYLGRKSCVPTVPVFQCDTDIYLDAEDAFRKYPLSDLPETSFGYKNRNLRIPAEIEDERGQSERTDKLVDADRRIFSVRRVRRVSYAREEIGDVSFSTQT